MWMHEQSLVIRGNNRHCDDWGNGLGYGTQDESSRSNGGGWGHGNDTEDMYETTWDYNSGNGWGGGVINASLAIEGDGNGEPGLSDVNDNVADGTGVGY